MMKLKSTMNRSKFWKAVLSLVLCMTFLWIGFSLWNWAFELAIHFQCSHKIFDALAFAFGFLGLISTCIINEWTTEKRQ